VNEAAVQMTPASEPSFLQKAGSAMLTIVKHVPTRAVLWTVVGFFLGLVADVGCFVLTLLTLERGALILGEPPFVLIPIAIPFVSAAIFGLHGAHRGAARAALEIESKLGLVRYVVGRVLAFVESRFGSTIANLPLDQAEAALKDAVSRYLGSGDATEGSGLSGFVLRRAKRSITDKIETYLLSAYRAEATAIGAGGGVDIGRLGARVTLEMSTKMGELVMSPVNKQLALFLFLVLGLGIGWLHLGLFLLSLLPSHT